MLPDFDKLASLESVSPDAFKSSNKNEQEVCDFVLALAVAYNDFKDVLWASSNLAAYRPQTSHLSPAYGQWTGMSLHITRLLHSLILEICQLIKENKKPRRHALFLKTYNKMSRENRKRWDSLVEFANTGTSQDELMKFLLVIRNAISFHYKDTKFIGRGFEKFFNGTDMGRDAAYASRGMSLRETRFYFGDAALQGGFELLGEKLPPAMVDEKLGALAKDINKTLFALINLFVQDRGFGWYKKPG